MRGTILYGPRDVRFEERDAPTILKSTDAIIRIAATVRGYNGRNSRWYQAAVRQKAGRIIAAGITKEVSFEPVNGPINDPIDEAYRAKYKKSPYLKPLISTRAREVIIRIMPR